MLVIEGKNTNTKKEKLSNEEFSAMLDKLFSKKAPATQFPKGSEFKRETFLF